MLNEEIILFINRPSPDPRPHSGREEQFAEPLAHCCLAAAAEHRAAGAQAHAGGRCCVAGAESVAAAAHQRYVHAASGRRRSAVHAASAPSLFCGQSSPVAAANRPPDQDRARSAERVRHASHCRAAAPPRCVTAPRTRWIAPRADQRSDSVSVHRWPPIRTAICKGKAPLGTALTLKARAAAL